MNDYLLHRSSATAGIVATYAQGICFGQVTSQLCCVKNKKVTVQ